MYSPRSYFNLVHSWPVNCDPITKQYLGNGIFIAKKKSPKEGRHFKVRQLGVSTFYNIDCMEVGNMTFFRKSTF
jgi:hypothetical protein